MVDKTIEVDVLISGCGIVGGTLACALIEGGLSVAIVDVKSPSETYNDNSDGRVTAVALSSQRLLENLNLWKTIDVDSTPIKEIRVADDDSLFFLHFDRDDVGADAFGYMVENNIIRLATANRLKKFRDLKLMAPNSILETKRNAGEVHSKLADGTVVKSKLIVGAEGRNSPTRDNAGITTTSWSYKQSAIVTTVSHEFSHDNVAHEHFFPGGPFAILPMSNNRSSIVWTERDELVQGIMALKDDLFLYELKKRFGDFLGDLSLTGSRWSYPLSLQFANQVVDHRIALVGDASHGMHPIAGQGLNMGFRDVGALAEVLTDSNRVGLDLGDLSVLQHYDKWRRFDNHLMLAVTDSLNRLFSNNTFPIRLFRDLGLATVNAVPPLKKFFINHAMGVIGRLPRLMRGKQL